MAYGEFLSDLLGLGDGTHSMHQGHVDQVLAQKPDLKLISTQNIADHKIIGSIIADRRGTARERTALADNDLMRVEQARKLDRHLFSATRRPLDLSCLSHIGRHGDAHPAEELNALCNGIHKLHLLVKMLVKEQM